jgi:outer membrane protein assembly factor BamB
MPYKLDDTHMIAGQTCFNPNNGDVYWTAAWDISPTTGFNTTFATGGGWGGGAGYSSTEKLFFTGGMAWDLSNPNNKPKIVWDISTTTVGGASFDAYGNGVVVVKSGDFMCGIDARTGASVWNYSATGGFTSYRGMVYEGVFYKGQIDKNVIAVNVTTGEEIWHYYDTTPFANFACGAAGAYGMVYMISGDGKIYAFDAKTGAIVWIYQSAGWNRYQGHPIVADGKIYASCPDIGGMDPYTGAIPDAYYVCLDAYTGKLLWLLKGAEVSASGGGAHLIAYGNLYMICEDGYLRCYSTETTKSDWPMFRHDTQLSGIGLSGPSTLSLKWKFTTQGQVYSSAAAVNGKIYIGSYDQNLYCLDAETGAKLWNYTTGTPIGWSPAVVNGRVYTGITDGYCYCLDANSGTLLWKMACGPSIPQNMTIGYLQSSPIIVGNKLFVGALDANLYCLDISNNGNILWSFMTVKTGPTGPNTGIKATPLIDGDTVWTVGTPIVPALGMFGSDGNISLWQLDFSGNVIKEIKYPYGAASAPTTATVFASPIIVGNYIIIPDQTVYWYCIDKTTGEVVWKYLQTYQTQFVTSASAYDGQVLLTDGFFCQSMNLTNGDIIWRAFLKREIFNSPTIAGYGAIDAIDRQNYKVYTSNNDNMFYILNMTDGEKLDWSLDPTSFIMSSFTLYKGTAICGSRDFTVYCYEEASRTTTFYPQLCVTSRTSQVTKGTAVTASGSVFPQVADLPVKISFIRPDNSVVDVDATTAADGSFQATYTPDVAGQWSIMSYYSGDSNKQYQSAYSNVVDLTVSDSSSPTTTTAPASTEPANTATPAASTAAPQQTVAPTVQPSTAAPQATQSAEPEVTQAPTNAPLLSNEVLAAIIVVVAVIIVAAAAFVLMKKRKK